jgi:hypothetical protein
LAPPSPPPPAPELQESVAPPASSPASTDDTLSTISEPDWLAELLEDRCDTAGERRTYVEQVVKDVAALRVELENAKLCLVCLSSERSAVVLPCKHAGFCDECAIRLLNAPCPLCKTSIRDCLIGMYC